MSFALPLPAYLRGKNCSAAVLTPQTVSVSGGVITLTGGTASDLKQLGVFDGFEYSANSPGAEIHPINGGVENWVTTFEAFTVKVTEIDRNGAVSVARTVWASNNYIRLEVDVSDESGVAGAVFACLVTRAGGSIDFGLVEEKNATVLTLRPCGVLPYYGTGTPPF